jgi:dissimilatory sulfite reductase (desulfoviridin) alpha/beta subunit
MNNTGSNTGSNTGFILQMPKVGVIKGVIAKDIEITDGRVVSLRTGARPYSNVYTATQLRAIKNILETYGSNKVHICPRHNFEIPEINHKKVDDALKDLYVAGLFPGGAGASVRNIFTCPSWCKEMIRPVGEIGKMISVNYGDMDMPNKVTISFAGCPNSCSRPQNCDIGIIGTYKISLTDKKCPDGCNDCVSVCKIKAITRNKDNIKIEDNCDGCGKCAKVCKPSVIKIDGTGFRILIGGKEGATVKFGQEYATNVQDFEVLDIVDRAISRYKSERLVRPKNKKKNERLGETVERLGLNKFMGE